MASPEILPAVTTVSQDDTITITGSGDIYYSVDGSAAPEDFVLYTGGIPVSSLSDGGEFTVRAYATDPTGDKADSEIVSKTYTAEKKAVAAPVITPAGGKISKDDSIIITGSGTIYYTADDSADLSDFILYTAPVPVSSLSIDGTSFTIRAYAVDNNNTRSEVTSGSYTLMSSSVALGSVIVADSNGVGDVVEPDSSGDYVYEISYNDWKNLSDKTFHVIAQAADENASVRITNDGNVEFESVDPETGSSLYSLSIFVTAEDGEEATY